jgi:transcriptional regulator GlxA family with amidase domain
VRDVIFALLPRVILLDLAGPADAFRNANTKVADSYRLRFVAPTSSLQAGIGLELASLEPLPTAVPEGAIIVLTGLAGATMPLDAPDTKLLTRWLASGITKNALLLCVCSGSVLAAAAGLLKGRECTTHFAHIDELRRVEPAARVLENRIFVEDGSVFTSAGVTAGLDLALYVIGQQLGPRVAGDVARDLVVYLRRSGSDPALSPWVVHRNHLHPAVHRVQDAVVRDPTAAWTAQQLSSVGCTSSRNLARLFAEHANCSPLDYVQLIRFAFAKELVTQSKLDLERVAAKAGFRSAQHLRRVWARWESLPPSAFRARDGHAAMKAIGAG